MSLHRRTMRLTIGKKLMGAFLIIVILMGISSSISHYYLKQVDDSYTELVGRRSTILANAQTMQLEAAKQSSRLRGYLLTKDPEYKNNLQTSYGSLSKLVSETMTLAYREEDKDKLRKLDELNVQFKQKYDQLLQMVQNGQNSTQVLDFYNNEVLAAGRQLEPAADEIASGQRKLMDEASVSNTEMVNSAIRTVSILSILACVLAILIGYFSSRMISRPIVVMEKFAEKIASGDISIDNIQVKNKDEIGTLAKSFNQMKENLHDLVRQISISAEHVAASSEELTASAEQTSRASESITTTIQGVVVSAERQSYSVEESVRAMNEMSAGVQQIAANTQVASSVSMQAAEKTLEGNKAIQSAEEQMESIHISFNQLAGEVKEMGELSGEIGQIIDVIVSIASQTNLLALNAAIEAARAGEQGRGFAVVAGEVRKLAEQSTQSAEQITQLITHIRNGIEKTIQSMENGTREINEGIRVVHTAGGTFEEIKGFVEHVATQVQEVSAASQQMSASAEQIVHSFEEISEGSQRVTFQSQNVASATEEQLASMEEISSSAASLSQMAEELQTVIGKFKV
ncbi:methyl-accepting chemotaxis protein [Paenibacillus alginolyticus]|uniref:methyl-accepting chemotaxis protein n=1 Tax=Paenibacillus alginolyticus TaxID=59839 RepID=UPI00042A3C7E|nr:methyl-accepting chemotaxis protein [Paenibacillus alginolyticus]MCY9666288.1 methyl-accepting chemotaxis protein [Paenibacillus alginolyticus]